MSEMPDFGDPKYVDVWADDVVTLSLQYSTQWDSLAHVGAEFDADGDGVEEPVYYNGYRAGVDLVGPQRRRRAATAAATARFAHHLGLEHMAFHGVQGRGVLVDLAHHLGHDWRGVDLDDARGDHGGRQRRGRAGRHAAAAHRLRHRGPAVDRDPDPAKIFTTCTLPRRPRRRRCSSGSPSRRSRRSSPTTTRSRGCSARTATRAGTRSCRSTTSACSSSASRSASCGTCTSWPTLAARARPEPLPAHRAAAAPARDAGQLHAYRTGRDSRRDVPGARRRIV